MCAKLAAHAPRPACLALMSGAILGLYVTPLSGVSPWAVFNASDSAERGFYTLHNRRPAVGDMVLARPSPSAEDLLVQRRYTAPGVPLLKRIEAGPSDEFCRVDDDVLINGAHVATARGEDPEGRPMPAWRGCHSLADNEFVLLQPHPDSFDSRYFGPVEASQIIGIATPIWTWTKADRRIPKDNLGAQVEPVDRMVR